MLGTLLLTFAAGDTLLSLLLLDPPMIIHAVRNTLRIPCQDLMIVSIHILRDRDLTWTSLTV